MSDRADSPRFAAEEPPPYAAEVFGPLLPLAQRYVGLLATIGIERGLIGPREAGRIWERHMLNSAALASLVPSGVQVVDVGSGAGLPGIPLALARPDLVISLLEPMARRVAFLTEVVVELGLRVHVQRGRVEDLPPASADIVVARAVAPLARLVPLTLPALRPAGRLLALKGASAAAEMSAARSALRSWPGATVTLTEVPAGAHLATVVVIDLDAEAQ